jgi:4a-hydroxytetrahydrobiopterin dehydratase
MIGEQLKEKKCQPCEGTTPPLSEEQEDQLMRDIGGWEIDRGGVHEIRKTFARENFREAIAFVNRVADLAEEQQHHPDITIRYSKVDIVLSTHKINGLSENDFIMAARIDGL